MKTLGRTILLTLVCSGVMPTTGCKSKDNFVHREPAIEKAQKRVRTLTVDLMQHATAAQAACDLPRILIKVQPDAIFIEGGSTRSHSNAKATNWILNNRARDRPGFNRSDGPMVTAYAYARRRAGVRIYIAESYNEDELLQLRNLNSERIKYGNLWDISLRQSRISQALEYYKMAARKIAESNLIRNNRIAQTIHDKDFNNAVLSIGDSHENIIRLLREAGMNVSAAKNLDYGDYLPRYFEEKQRGWKTKQKDENLEAIQAVLSRVLIKEYVTKGFGSVAHCGVVARSTIPKTISMDVFEKILLNGPKHKYSMIEGLKAENIDVPDTKEEFLEALKRAGVYGCR